MTPILLNNRMRRTCTRVGHVLLNDMKSGLLFISIAACALLAVSCAPDGSRKAARDESRVLMERLDVLTADATRAQEQNRVIERALASLREESAQKEKEALAERESLRKKTDEAIKALEDYKAKYRITLRSRAKGTRLAEIDGVDAGKFQNVEILELTPGEVRFHHQSGIATVSLGRLPAALRETLGYDPAESAAWLAAEHAKLLAAKGDGALIRESFALSTTLSKKKKIAAFDTGVRGRLKASLNELSLRGTALQNDRNCCPVHKRSQLAEMAQDAARIKQRLASLPP